MLCWNFQVQLLRGRRAVLQITRLQWTVMALFLCCLGMYSWRKTYEYDAGLIMTDLAEPRPLAEYRLRPWKVERTLKHGVCGTDIASMEWGMVILVKSALRHKDRRAAIRKAWAGVETVGKVIFQTVFIVGETDDKVDKAEVEIENKLHGDILMYNLPDTRRFLSDKIISGMQWASENLQPPWLYSSTDDDFVLHPLHLASYFTKLLPKYNSHIPIVCVYNYQWWDSPDRDSTSKWFCSKDLYPGWYWPRYCRGGMYTMTSSMVTRLFAVSRRTVYLHLDDVWITGLMRWKLGENDSNIMPGPMSQRFYYNFFADQDPETALVQHTWGNVQDFKKVESVSKEITRVWKTWTEHFPTDAKLCYRNDTQRSYGAS